MALLDGKKLLITGVLTEASLAWGVARLALEEGADVVLTGAGRGMRTTVRHAAKLPPGPDGEPIPVLELDVTEPAHADRLRGELEERWGRVDGALHAIGFAPPSCLGKGLFPAPWEDVSVAMHVSVYSLRVLADVVVPLMPDGGSIVGLDFDATQAWPVYDWMGVAKAALESTSRYLARELGPRGIRVNLVAAGPIRTIAARSIPGFERFEEAWADRAPLGWDVRDTEAVAQASVVLLSDWFPRTTGEIVHVDGGFHAVGG